MMPPRLTLQNLTSKPQDKQALVKQALLQMLLQKNMMSEQYQNRNKMINYSNMKQADLLKKQGV